MSDNLKALEDKIARLEGVVDTLQRRVTVCEDEQSIRKLHHLYGYLLDKCLYREAVDLFTPDCEVRFFGGIYKNKAGAHRLYVERFQKNFTKGNNGPVDGFLLDHPQHQDIVDIADDGETAYGRFRCTMQAGKHKDFADDTYLGRQRQWWEGGIYENTYRKINGVWHIHVLNYVPQWHADFETGWAHTKENYVPFLSTTYPEDPAGPDDLIPREAIWLWPSHRLVPFHQKHPITGEEITAERLPEDLARDQSLASKN